MQGTVQEHERVVRWSRFPNTIMKVSSLPDQNAYPHRDVAPVVRKLTDAFGAERMIYGGGFNATATGKSYRAYRDRVGELLSHLTDEERGRFRQWQIAQETHWDNMFFQYQQGFIDEEYYRDSFRMRVGRLAPTWRALNVGGARQSFAEEIETILAEVEAPAERPGEPETEDE